MKKIDFHVHINSPIPIDDTVKYFNDMCKRFGYCGVGIMSIIAGSSYGDDPGCNDRALKLKRLMPGSFAFAALDHKRDFINQTREYMLSGFDGIKILEGKPSVYRYYGYGLDCERFDRFFEYAQKEQIPIMLHNCDPEQNWDISRADERAIKMGWCYDESMPRQAYFYQAFEKVLCKYPNLRIAAAHMGFYANRLDIASRLLENCPNMYFDITPALIIYSQLSDNKDAPEFFRKYQDRLIYGTDADNGLFGFAREYNDKKVRVITAFLESSSPCLIDGIQINPIAADNSILQKIYAQNAINFLSR